MLVRYEQKMRARVGVVQMVGHSVEANVVQNWIEKGDGKRVTRVGAVVGPHDQVPRAYVNRDFAKEKEISHNQQHWTTEGFQEQINPLLSVIGKKETKILSAKVVTLVVNPASACMHPTMPVAHADVVLEENHEVKL